MMKTIAFIAAIALPLFNIPLIVRVIKRRSSEDMSVTWALGVWVCFLLMAPEAFRSPDIVWRAFSIANLALFTIVTAVVLLYRKRR
jgi:carbon starvation protein CstA